MRFRQRPADVCGFHALLEIPETPEWRDSTGATRKNERMFFLPPFSQVTLEAVHAPLEWEATELPFLVRRRLWTFSVSFGLA